MSSPVRIARIITRLNIGGPAVQALSLSTLLTRDGFDTLLVHGQADSDEGDIRSMIDPGPRRTVCVESLRRPIRPLEDVRAFFAIYRLLRTFKPALVHTHTGKAGALGRLAALLYNFTGGQRRRARIVHTYHGHVFDGYFGPGLSAALVSIERRLARGTDILIAISPSLRDEIAGHYRIGRLQQMRVVPLGLDLSPLAAIDDRRRAAARIELDVPPGTPVVTTVGRLTPIKQQHLFLAMAAELTNRGTRCLFLVVGDGALRRELEAHAHHLGLRDQLRFLGWRSDLERIYAATSVFVLTSANEGTPVALIEAMAAGVACVSTDVGGVRDVITDPGSGVVVSPATADALTAAVESLLDRESARQQTGASARESVVCRFSIDRLVRDLSALYRELQDA